MPAASSASSLDSRSASSALAYRTGSTGAGSGAIPADAVTGLAEGAGADTS
jgi:hypothetical protein